MYYERILVREIKKMKRQKGVFCPFFCNFAHNIMTNKTIKTMRKLFLILLTFVAVQGLAAKDDIVNPMLWADTPDPDVIRVGDT